jgi:cytidylate kinase
MPKGKFVPRTGLTVRMIGNLPGPIKEELKDRYFGRRPLVVAVNGPAGAGKTTLMTNLECSLGTQSYQAGLRALAEEEGVSLEEMQERADKDPKIDYKVDAQTIRRILEHQKTGNGVLVISARMAAYLNNPQVIQRIKKELGRDYADLQVPSVPIVRVYMSANSHVAAKRNFMDVKKRVAEGLRTLKIAREKIERRNLWDKNHYKQIYDNVDDGVDVFDTARHDFVIDTSRNPHPALVMLNAVNDIRNTRLSLPFRNKLTYGAD